ncbi:NAD-dependent DNA ligase LigA [Patescibacteria group bacterium]|nr:NAD-dependent DNA ligase LigA [Patescibacteria group bacterium]
MMLKKLSKKEAQKRIINLRKEINHHNHLYYVLDQPKISDAAWDSLKKELESLEKQYPELITPDSPTQRVGGEPLKKFKKVKHLAPVLSIEDVFDFSELESWKKYLQDFLKKRNKEKNNFTYYCERKIDGVDINLTYEKGILKQAVTRGNGLIGEDVTNNIKTIGSIPLKIKKPLDIVVRGEIFMRQKDFEVLNQKREKKGLPLYANPRNLVAGSIRQLDSRIAAQRSLDSYIFEIVSDCGQKTHQEVHQILKELGFKIDERSKYCQNLKEVKEYYKKQLERRERSSFAYDGVVVLVNDIAQQRELGRVGRSPRWARAYKFPGEQATSLVKDIVVQVGRTGALTPVAILEPTSLGGSTVSRATLHNENEIRRLGVKIKDTVIIEKAGDIIPAVVGVLKNLRTGQEKAFQMPFQCPVCQGPIVRRKGEVAHYCSNPNCFAIRLREINHFVSQKGFNVDGLGPKIVERLMAEGLIKNAADLFNLQKGDLKLLERFAEKSAKNLIEAIQKSKEVNFSNFIYALGIRHIGQQTSVDLASSFVSLEKLSQASIDYLNSLPGMGPEMANSVSAWFQKEKNIKLIEDLKKAGLKIKYPFLKQDLPWFGRKFVFTGTLSTMSRPLAANRVRNLGGRVSGNISQHTDFLVYGDSPGAKYKKAQKEGIKTLSEKEFLKFLKQND